MKLAYENVQFMHLTTRIRKYLTPPPSLCGHKCSKRAFPKNNHLSVRNHLSVIGINMNTKEYY